MLILTKDKVKYEHAQHIYINESVPPPPPGTQIYCGNLPRGMLEIELFPYFSLIGEIYEFRLMMEFSGFSRGFCFVTYMTVEQANQAVASLHGYVLKDRELAVYKSWDNTKLYITGIPPMISPQQVRDDLRTLFPEITNVVCEISEDTGYHNGWAFLEFDTHRNASLCRKKIWPNKLNAWGSVLQVEWARPIRSTGLREDCTLILLNVPPQFNKVDVYDLVKPYLKPKALMVVTKTVGSCSAKLEFNSISAMNIALRALEGATINNIKLYARKQTSLKFVQTDQACVPTTSSAASSYDASEEASTSGYNRTNTFDRSETNSTCSYDTTTTPPYNPAA